VRAARQRERNVTNSSGGCTKHEIASSPTQPALGGVDRRNWTLGEVLRIDMVLEGDAPHTAVCVRNDQLGAIGPKNKEGSEKTKGEGGYGNPNRNS
jgi:hypothetical protein